jgi:hypothetical protein
MIDVEQALKDELDRLTPVPGPADWSEVLTLAGHRRARRGRRWAMVLVAFAATAGIVVAVAVATPLGAAIANGLGGFSTWLSGEPGKPAPSAAQQAFARANARSWHGFPAGTQLRQLITTTNPKTGRSIRLLGFRTGTTLCIRIAVIGRTAQACAPLADLRQAGAPVRVVLVDAGFGKGTKKAWYGVQRVGAPALQITAGIAADGVKNVIVKDNSGRHTVAAISDAFLYVASDPNVGQRVSQIWAETAKGLIPIPFAPAPFGFFSGIGASTQQSVTGPTQVQRHVSGGTIGWLDKHETLGQSLDILPGSNGQLVRRHVVFGRILTLDPGSPMRIALTLSASHNGGKPTGLCTWQITSNNGVGGGCAVRADLFTSGPLSSGTGGGSGSGEYETFTGLASDDVHRIVAFLANGQTQPITLTDNIYAAEIARSKLPARLVAYDSAGRIIGVGPVVQGVFGHLGNGGGSPARGKAVELLNVVSPTGATAELLVGKSTTGGECVYVHHYENPHASGDTGACYPPTWQGSPIQFQDAGAPGLFWGRTRGDVSTVQLHFASGGEATIKPTTGFLLYAVPDAHLATGRGIISATALNTAGKSLGTQSLEPGGSKPRK